MDNLISQIKDANYSHSRITADMKIEDSSYEMSLPLKPSQKRFFRLTKIPKQEQGENNYSLAITLPNFEILEKDLNDFKSASDIFTKILSLEVLYYFRIFFHYSVKEYRADPDLPVVLDEKKSDIGKLVLNGVRVTFPDYKEFDSVILDVQPCPHCKEEDLISQVMSERKSVYSLEFLTTVIKQANGFSKNFVKIREKK